MKGWTIRYTTDLTDEVWFYLRGEEYSAQIDYFCAQRGSQRRLDGVNTFSFGARSRPRGGDAARRSRAAPAAVGATAEVREKGLLVAARSAERMSTMSSPTGHVMDRVLFGDNQFFGVNHMSEDKARAQAMRFQDLQAIIDVLDAALRRRHPHLHVHVA